MTIKINGDNTVANPGFSGDDTDTGLQVGTNELKLVTGGSEAVTVDSSQNVGIGTNSPAGRLHVVNEQGGGTGRIIFDANVSSGYNTQIDATDTGLEFTAKSNSRGFAFNIGSTPTEKVRITAGGNVGIGTSSPATELEVNGDIGIGRSAGGYTFREVVGGGERAGIKSNSNNELVFLTANAVERCRINGSGHIRFNQNSSDQPGASNSTVGLGLQRLNAGCELFISRSDGPPFLVNRNSNGTVVDLRRSGSQKGNIQVTTSTATFNSASDYRLKENVVALSDGITRLKQLSPSRFNFIEEPDTTVDGFIAHEVQAVVPQAVTGTHNEVDDDGNPVMQAMDYGKVTPLLTAALQEAIAKIETLEAQNADLLARVTALENA